MATALELSASQKERTEALFWRMEAKATFLGHALIAQERLLDEEFASKTITQKSMGAILQRIGGLQAEVCGAHLEAHLAQLAILTPSQIAQYQTARGYTGADSHPSGHQHMHQLQDQARDRQEP